MSELATYDAPALRRALERNAAAGDGSQLAPFVNDALRCLEPGAAATAEKSAAVFKAVIDFADDGRLVGTEATACIHSLLAHVAKLTPQHADSLLDALISGFARHASDATTEYEGEILDLIPPLLTVAPVGHFVPGAASKVAGRSGGSGCPEDIQARALRAIVAAEWPSHLSIHVATVLKDIPMSATQRREVVARIVRQFDAVDFIELPALVYQALLLTARGDDKVCRRLVLSAFTAHFEKVSAGLAAEGADLATTRAQFDARDEEKLSQVDTEDIETNFARVEAHLAAHRAREVQLRRVEATVVHHFNFAIKQDHAFGLVLLELCAAQGGGGGSTLTAFKVALLMSTIEIAFFEQRVLALIKQHVALQFASEAQRDASPWVRREAGAVQRALVAAKGAPSARLPAEVLLATARDGGDGGSQLAAACAPSLLKLGFALLGGAKAPFATCIPASAAARGAKAKSALEAKAATRVKQRAAARCVALGHAILATLFAAHDGR
jgi:hypothetical protein